MTLVSNEQKRFISYKAEGYLWAVLAAALGAAVGVELVKDVLDDGMLQSGRWLLLGAGFTAAASSMSYVAFQAHREQQ